MREQRQPTRREFLQMAALMVSGTAVAACTAVAPQQGAATTNGASEPVAVRYVFVADPGELEIRQKGVDEFQAAHPEIQLSAELVPEDGMAEKIVTMVAGGAAPDVIYLHPSFIPLFGSQGVLAPLDDLAQADSDYHVEDFYKTITDYFVFAGKTYGYAYYSGPLVTYFNKTLFDQAGEPYPSEYMAGFEDGKDGWTWDKALEVAQRMTKGEGADRVFGNWPLSTSLHWFNHVIWSFGGEVWNEEMTKCLLSEPAALAAIQYEADLIMTHKVEPMPEQMEGMAGDFSSGRVAMNTSGIKASVPGLVAAGLEVGMAPVPSGPGGRFTRDGPNALGILQSSKVKEASWQWVKYMTGPKLGDPGGIKFEFAMHRALPTRQSLYDAGEFKNNLLPWEELEVYRNASQHVRAFPLPARYPEINASFREHWGTILTGAVGVEEAMAAACADIDQLLTEPV